MNKKTSKKNLLTSQAYAASWQALYPLLSGAPSEALLLKACCCSLLTSWLCRVTAVPRPGTAQRDNVLYLQTRARGKTTSAFGWPHGANYVIQFNKPQISILQYHPYLLPKEYQKCYYITVSPLLVPLVSNHVSPCQSYELPSSDLLTSLLHLLFYFLFVGMFCLYFTYIPSVFSESLFSFSSIALCIHRLLAGVNEWWELC